MHIAFEFLDALQLKIAVQRIRMLFSNGAKASWLQTDSFPTEMWNFFCRRRSLFTVYSQCALFTVSPQILLFANNIPKLDTSQFEMQFHMSHKQAMKCNVMQCNSNNIPKLDTSHSTIRNAISRVTQTGQRQMVLEDPENSLVHRSTQVKIVLYRYYSQIDSKEDCSRLVHAVSCFK